MSGHKHPEPQTAIRAEVGLRAGEVYILDIMDDEARAGDVSGHLEIAAAIDERAREVAAEASEAAMAAGQHIGDMRDRLALERYTWENAGDDRVRPEHTHPERYASKLRHERCVPLELTKRGRILADRRAEMARRKARKHQGVPKGPANCDGRTRGAFGRLVV